MPNGLLIGNGFLVLNITQLRLSIFPCGFYAHMGMVPLKFIRRFTMKSLVIVALLSLVSFSAIAGDYSGSGYESSETRRMQSQQIGTIDDIREVVVHDNNSVAQYGSIGIGGALGGLLGQVVGGNSANGKTAASLVLAAAGAVAGNKINTALSADKALEIVVVTDDGRAVVITQTMDKNVQSLSVGDRVRIVQGANSRVVKLRNTRTM